MENGNTKENIGQETVYVENGQSCIVKHPDIAFAEYIEGQNLGIAILNKRKKIGYVANLKSPIQDVRYSSNKNLWIGLIDQALEEIGGDVDDLEVTLVGNPPPSKEERYFYISTNTPIIIKDQEWIDFNNSIVKHFSDKGVKDIKNNLYDKDKFHNYSLKVDTLKCSIELDINEGRNPFLLD